MTMREDVRKSPVLGERPRPDSGATFAETVRLRVALARPARQLGGLLLLLLLRRLRLRRQRLGALLGEVVDEIDLGDDTDDRLALRDDRRAGVREDALEELDLRIPRHRRVVALEQRRDRRARRLRPR